jgi:putative ABC transport system ATP-binding protein
MENPLIKNIQILRDFVLEKRLFVLKGIDLVINKGEYVALMDLQDQENLL